jgi:LPXTG-motif cell wall-anchored protein
MKRRRATYGGEGEDGGASRKLFLFVLGLAGLGVGVWLFRRRRKG